MSDQIEQLLKEIGSYREGTGLRGENRALSDQCERFRIQRDELRECLQELIQWFDASPEDIFTPLEGCYEDKTGDYDTEEKRNLITRASAAMARHMISRIPETIRQRMNALEAIDG